MVAAAAHAVHRQPVVFERGRLAVKAVERLIVNGEQLGRFKRCRGLQLHREPRRLAHHLLIRGDAGILVAAARWA